MNSLNIQCELDFAQWSSWDMIISRYFIIVLVFTLELRDSEMLAKKGNYQYVQYCMSLE
jgi:hypothetical protein